MLTLNCESIEAGVTVARLGRLKAVLVDEDAKRLGDGNVEGLRILLCCGSAEVSIVVVPFKGSAASKVECGACRDDVGEVRQPNRQHRGWLKTTGTQRSLFEGGKINNRMEPKSIDVRKLPDGRG